MKLCLIFDTHGVKQRLLDELQCLCVALLFEDVISSLIKQSMWYDTIEQVFFNVCEGKSAGLYHPESEVKNVRRSSPPCRPPCL